MGTGFLSLLPIIWYNNGMKIVSGIYGGRPQDARRQDDEADIRWWCGFIFNMIGPFGGRVLDLHAGKVVAYPLRQFRVGCPMLSSLVNGSKGAESTLKTSNTKEVSKFSAMMEAERALTS